MVQFRPNSKASYEKLGMEERLPTQRCALRVHRQEMVRSIERKTVLRE